MSFHTVALIEASLLGLLCGITGTIVVLRRRAFFTVALTHATFPGGIVAALLGVSVLLGAAVFSVVLVLVMTAISRVKRQGSQVASGVILTGGFALGMLLQSLNPSLPVQVDTLLVGSILTVAPGDVIAAAAVLVAALLILAVAGKELLFSSFDPWGFRAAGYREHVVDALALGLIAATVVVAMPAVGAILAIALIVGPAAAAGLLVTDVRRIIPVAGVLGVVSGILGLEASRAWGVAAGGAISLVSAAFYVIALAVRQLRTARRATARRDERHHHNPSPA